MMEINNVSCLHLVQNNGKLKSVVSCRNFIRAFIFKNIAKQPLLFVHGLHLNLFYFNTNFCSVRLFNSVSLTTKYDVPLTEFRCAG